MINLPWRHYSSLRVDLRPPVRFKRRYSVTADILAYKRCSIQYGTFVARKYEPALAVQLFYGTIIHQVLDRAHAHYRGLIGPQIPGTLPTDENIETYFSEVENSLRARRIRAIEQVRNQALEVLKRFNSLEGPSLYSRILDTECRLQADQESYILHGNVDVLASTEGDESEVEIWDYKGSEKPSRHDSIYQQYVFQMQVYAELYRRKTGKTPQRAILYFLNALKGDVVPLKRPVNATLEVEIDPLTVIEAMDNFNDTVEQIEHCRGINSWQNPNEKPPKDTCSACDLRWNCSATIAFGNTFPLLYP